MNNLFDTVVFFEQIQGKAIKFYCNPARLKQRGAEKSVLGARRNGDTEALLFKCSTNLFQNFVIETVSCLKKRFVQRILPPPIVAKDFRS